METMFYPDEVRPITQVPNLPEEVNVNDKELSMAKMLIDQLTTPFEASKYKDDYRAAFLEAIERKIAGEEVQTSPQVKKSNVIDLMAALQASLEAVKKAPAPKAASEAKPKASSKKQSKEKVLS